MLKGKKMLVVGLLAVCSLFVVSSALADDETSVANSGKLVIGTHADATDKEIGLSKGVEVRYVNDVTTKALAQWYVVAAVHSGGNKGYATAQNLTNIMVTEYAPGEATSTILTTIPVLAASKEDWPAGPITAWLAQ